LIVELLEAFWIIAYVLIVRRSLLDKTYGVPVIAMCGNIGWEIIYGLNIIPVCKVSATDCSQIILQIRDFLAMSVDVAILFTILRFGAAQFERFPNVKKYWIPLVLFGVTVATGLVYLIESTFYVLKAEGDLLKYMPILLQGGLYTGFALEFDMDILFVGMLLSRNSVAGQSLYIALTKMFGSIFAYISIYIANEHTPLINFMFAVSLIFDIIYTVLVYQKCKEQGINPWRRF
jgi:hypothetical protein